MRDQLRITEPVRAVRLHGDSVGAIVEIGTDAVVEFCGDAPLAGLVEIDFGGQRLALFHGDLKHRSERVYSAAVAEHVLTRLREDVAQASEQARIAAEHFNAIIHDTPSGLPHPDGTQRIHNARLDVSLCRANLTLAMSRLNDFVIRRIVPDDLKE